MRPARIAPAASNAVIPSAGQVTDITPARRAGFTLLEVVIASGLMLFLLVTVFSTIRYVYAAENASQDELLLFRTGNGLLDAMQRDLDAAVRLIDPATTTDNADTLDAADGSDLGTTGEATGIDPALDQMRQRIGGDEFSWTAVISQPRRPAEESNLPAEGTPLSLSTRHRSVAWYMDDGSSGGDPGLRRETYLPDLDSVLVPLESMTDTTTSAMMVQYFDGYEWLPSWDAIGMTVHPVALEVTLTLSTADDKKRIVMSRVLPVAGGRYAVPSEDTLGIDEGLPQLELGL